MKPTNNCHIEVNFRSFVIRMGDELLNHIFFPLFFQIKAEWICRGNYHRQLFFLDKPYQYDNIDCGVLSSVIPNYHTCAIITCGLYIFHPLFLVHLCTVTFGLMYGQYSRAVFNQERVIVAPTVDIHPVRNSL